MVATAISNRLAELRTTQMEVATRARISLTTLRELQHNISPRRRRPQTLAALSEALGWPADYLAQLLSDGDAALHSNDESGPARATLASIERELGELRDRVDQIERRLDVGGDE